MSQDNSASNRGLIWSPQAYSDLQTWMRGLPRIIDERVHATLRSRPTFQTKDIRYGVTTTNGDTYPSKPANTFWVKLGTPSFGETPGNNSLGVVPYSPESIRLAYNAGGYVEENTPVCLGLSHGQYFILGRGGGGGDIRYVQFELTENYNAGVTAATFTEMSGAAIGSGVLRDPQGIGAGLYATNKGYALQQDDEYYFVQASCPVDPDPPEE